VPAVHMLQLLTLPLHRAGHVVTCAWQVQLAKHRTEALRSIALQVQDLPYRCVLFTCRLC